MRQHSMAPLLAVILAAVLSGGKSFSQSLASHAICLPDTGMRLLLPLPLLLLTAAFLSTTPSHHLLLSPSILTSYFFPALLTHQNLTCSFSFYTYSTCTFSIYTVYLTPIYTFHFFSTHFLHNLILLLSLLLYPQSRAGGGGNAPPLAVPPIQ